MKKLAFVVTMIAALSVFPVLAQTASRAGVTVDHFAARNFVAGAIPQADLDLIIQAGVRAPSAGNRQPWNFTVVRNLNLARTILNNQTPQQGNVVIVVSIAEQNVGNVLDSALAVQSMNLAAQQLGYGARIYTGPIGSINQNHRAALGIPNRFATAAILIGRTSDTISGASPRNATNTMVTFRD